MIASIVAIVYVARVRDQFKPVPNHCRKWLFLLSNSETVCNPNFVKVVCMTVCSQIPFYQ